MLLGSARNRAPSLHRGGRHRTYRPRRASGDAPARGTRRGSSDGMAPRHHLTAFTGRARSPKQGAGTTRSGSKRAGAGERGGALPGHAPRKRQTAEGFPRDGQPSRGRTRTEAASLARRRIPGSRACPRVEHALQISVVQSWPREADGSSHRSKRSRSSRRGTGARSRVNISDGVERRSPGRSRRHDVLFVGPLRETFTEASGRKARDGIGEALGSPSVLPKEGTSDRPLSSRLHGSDGNGGLGSNETQQSSERAAPRERAGDRGVRSSIARSYSGEHPGS
jgi:hypothetical protein